MSDYEFETLVQLARLPQEQRIAGEPKLSAIYQERLESGPARDVLAMLLGSDRPGCLASSWCDLVLQAADASK